MMVTFLIILHFECLADLIIWCVHYANLLSKHIDFSCYIFIYIYVKVKGAVRAFPCSSRVRWFQSTHSITKMWWFELPLSLTVKFNSIGWIKVVSPHTRVLSKLRWEGGSEIHFWIIHLLSGRGAHSFFISSHPIVVYHPYTWKH